jgi:hypothetical protein
VLPELVDKGGLSSSGIVELTAITGSLSTGPDQPSRTNATAGRAMINPHAAEQHAVCHSPYGPTLLAHWDPSTIRSCCLRYNQSSTGRILIRRSDRVSVIACPPLFLWSTSHGSFCMVKRKWVRFGIIPIEKKFSQVLEGCIRAKEGSAGSVGLQRAVSHHTSGKIFVRQCSLIIGWFRKTLG